MEGPHEYSIQIEFLPHHAAGDGADCEYLSSITSIASEPKAGRSNPVHSSYRVLAPIESGNLLLFPVVESGRIPASPFITLDEGIKNGQVEVTEAGRIARPRTPAPDAGQNLTIAFSARIRYPILNYRGDQVNTLVLVNNSDKPLLLLAGEIVTGGKQDRIIAKDRIVPAAKRSHRSRRILHRTWPLDGRHGHVSRHPPRRLRRA